MKSVYTIDELAERWGCTRKSVVAAIADGRLHAFKVGTRTRRVTEAEVLRFERHDMAPRASTATR